MTGAPWRLSAVELPRLYLARELSPVEVLESVSARADQLDPVLHVFITRTPERALREAEEAESAYRRGDTEPPLLGVPVTIKDLAWTRGVRTTSGSLLHAEFVPAEDAPVAERLRAAGAVMLGKTSVPEFGWKAETTNRLVGSTHNPWKLGATAGGSSGGAAAGVAAGMGPIAQGSDGAGSIRIPAAFCGVFGLKPTFGTVPIWPASSTDRLSHVGPITRSVADAALMMGVIAGPDPRDMHSQGRAIPDFQSRLDAGIEGVEVVWSPDLGYVDVDPEIARSAHDAVGVLERCGAVVRTAAEGIADPWPIVHAMWASAEAAEYQEGLTDELRARLDPGRVRVIESGFGISGGQLSAAVTAGHDHFRAVEELLGSADLLATPTVPVAAFPVGQDSPVRDGDPTSYLGWTGFTYPFNLSGHPAATVPCGFTAGGLPIGLQILGRWGRDDLVLRAAAAFERAAPWLAGLLALSPGG